MHFTRNPPSKRYKDYRRYRQYTRRDFKRFCAYCFRHELEAGGEEHFEQDHFEPRSRPNVDPADYLNLYWSCRGCNAPQNKGNAWPTEAQLERGERFCDPCEHDPVGTDYVLKKDGLLEAVTPAGRYTIRHIRLNERPDLVENRVLRREYRQTYRQRLAELRQTLEWRQAAVEVQGDQTVMTELASLQEMVEAYEDYVTTDPFKLHDVPPGIPADVIDGLSG